MFNRPLSLGSRQRVRSAAATLPVGERDNFLRPVACHLASEPSDDAVRAAIDAQLALGRLPVFLCDGAPTRGEDEHETTPPNR